jgi:hypothetical protein
MSFLFPHKNDLASTNSQDMFPCFDLKKSHTLFVALEKGYNSLVGSSYLSVPVRKLFSIKKKSRARAGTSARLAIFLLVRPVLTVNVDGRRSLMIGVETR